MLLKALAETGSISCQKERDDKCSTYLLDRFSFANKVLKKTENKKNSPPNPVLIPSQHEDLQHLSTCHLPWDGTVRLKGEIQAPPSSPHRLSLHNTRLM